MNKGELVDAIAKATGLTKAASANALEAVLDAVTDTLKAGDKVTIPGFGTFSTSKRTERTGRNPQTGKEIKIAAKTIAKFKAGKKLSDSVG